tara:strand:+ start:330 stop:1271 length:942 start_codon:yes stop_codon:yes gene_type:complete
MELTPKQFEKLLCQFCEQDLPASFKVEHDIKDFGSESENKRQIDTRISGRLGVSDILICGEAKNWSEKVGGDTIDGLVGKYLSNEIKANKVICFSMMGFTQPAIKRAKTLGIELLQPHHLGSPIIDLPYIVGVGILGKLEATISSKSRQENLIGIQMDDYLIIKGNEEISFLQNVKRLVVERLQSINRIGLETDISKLRITDSNVLYELKQKEGYRYYANFDVDVNLQWDYFLECLSTGVLKHLNTKEIHYVNLQGSVEDIVTKVLQSKSKRNFETKEYLNQALIKYDLPYRFHLCLADPDRFNTHPSLEIIT